MESFCQLHQFTGLITAASIISWILEEDRYMMAQSLEMVLNTKGKKSKKGRKEGKGNKDLSNIKCYNYNKKGHYTRDCQKPKKEKQDHKANKAEGSVLYAWITISKENVALAANSIDLWIAVSSPTSPVAKSRDLEA